MTNVVQFILDKGVFSYLRCNSLVFLTYTAFNVSELYLLWTLRCSCEHPALPRVRCLQQDSEKIDKHLTWSQLASKSSHGTTTGMNIVCV